MFPKRQPREEGEGDSGNQNKRRLIRSSLFKGARNVRNLQEIVPTLEPLIQKWVREEVVRAFDRVKRPSSSGIGYSGSRTLQLQFCSKLPSTLYTGGKVVSEDGSPIRVILCDSISKDVVRFGPFSSAKVTIVALDGDFDPDDQTGWSKEEFDRNIVQSREGKRPLLTGELAVSLQNGEAQIGQVIFTDNSSWTRSRKFRLGAKAHFSTNEICIREAMSNRFKIKDHRGELYEKHYPPSLDDKVWRLEKIAKDGVFHKKLTKAGITCVQDFLSWYETSQHELRSVLGNIPKNTWDKIIRHATSCILDEKRYSYMVAPGTELFFNSICKLVGVRFDWQSYQWVDNLDTHQMRTVEGLKQHAYENREDWILVSDAPYIGFPTLPVNPTHNSTHPSFGLSDKTFHIEQGQPEMQVNNSKPAISSPYADSKVDQHHGCFEIGESSQMQGYRNSFGMSAFSPGMFGGHTWIPSPVYLESPMSAEDLPVNDHFLGEPSSAWQGNELLVPDSDNHEINAACSNSGIAIPRILTPKTRWYKLLSVVKWQILVKRSMAARKWKQFFDGSYLP